MSLTALASSFADAYVNGPALRTAGRNDDAALVGRRGAAGVAAALVGVALPLPANAPDPNATIASSLKALTDYIPSEVLTVYIAAIAAITHWTFAPSSSSNVSNVYLLSTYWICLAACPLWTAIGIFLSSSVRPRARAFIWPMVAAPVAFYTYALAIPDSWLAARLPNGGLVATLLLLLITPILHVGTLLYVKLFPPN